MKLSEALYIVRQTIASELNSRLVENNLKTLTYLDTPPNVETDRYTLGIYLAAPDGKVITRSSDWKITTAVITLDGVIDDKYNSPDVEEYLSVLMTYLDGKTFCFGSDYEEAEISRTALGMSVNGFLLALDVIIAVRSDKSDLEED